MRELMMANDLAGIQAALEKKPALANEGVACFDKNPAKAHPLHRICDGVHLGLFTDEDAVEMARIFLEYGADIDGGQLVSKKDTPLIAAASLDAVKTGIFYISRGADIFHAGTHGGTAIHWAAWTGSDKLVKALIDKGADVNRNCADFKGTPLLWAVHGYKNARRQNQLECARLLVAAGADRTVTNIEGHTLIEFLEPGDIEMIAIIQ